MLRVNTLIGISFIAMLAACGGGDVGVHGLTTTQPTSQPTTAVLTLSTIVSGEISTGTTINSYDVALTLPAGVTVKSTANPPVVDDGVVTAIGSAAGSLIVALYAPPTSTEPGRVKIHLVSAAGFIAGEFGVVNCNIAAGAFPQPSNFEPAILQDATGYDSTSGSTVMDLEQELLLLSTAVVF